MSYDDRSAPKLNMFKFLFEFLQSGKQNNQGRKTVDAKLKVYLDHLQSANTIDAYRDRFRSSPLGRWSQTVGTFSCVMDEIWEFKSDYSGRIIETGPFGGSRGEILFEWKEIADYTIACKVTKWSYEDDAEEEQEEEDESVDGSEWNTIRYDFKIVPTDCRNLVAMCQVSDDRTSLNGFWLSMEPLINKDI